MIRGLLYFSALLLGLLTALFVQAAAAQAPAEHPLSVHVYDMRNTPSARDDGVSERGSPLGLSSDNSIGTHNVSATPGGSARVRTATIASHTTYDRPARPAGVNRSTNETPAPSRATGAHVGVIGVAVPVLQPTGVAAKTTAGLADEAGALLGKSGDVVVLGRQADTAVAKGWDGHVVLDTPNWSLDLNDAFMRGAIDQGRSIYLASPTKGNLVQTAGQFAGQPTVYARELQMLRDAGYSRVGDYMVPR